MTAHLDLRLSRGAALLITLWCVAIVAIVVVTLARVVDADVDTEKVRAKRFEAREFALSGMAHGMNPKLERDSEFFNQTLPSGGEWHVRIVGEASRININTVLADRDSHILERLFRLWGLSDEEVRIVTDSLGDWVDRDGLARLNGAEREQLLGQDQYSLPENRNFRSVNEMSRVRGMDAVARVKPDWKDFFTVYGNGKIDIQDASADVLEAAGLTATQAEAVLEIRNGGDRLPGTPDDPTIKDISWIAEAAGIDPERAATMLQNFQLTSEPTRVESVGILGGTRYRITSVLDRKQGTPFSWEEE
ncbi:type II secretory pathway, component PulK [Terrimicrobium sacchariphilum]|uniref:Type II secretory pathway, component PulK n=1 Tax=Terrimicrobium sacchariphilum TaxID=690879 RepID=A0A146G9Z1_TERSA|nr:type II secretion system protein GspK [Terrimicrobium sacchariphilum]GAT34251.1 type II secretory pathway, component PulK [Terrimicrobium sacchariphilum]